MIAVMKRVGKAPELYETSGRASALKRELGGWFNSVNFASDACILFRDGPTAASLPFNVELIGLDFYGTIIIMGVRDGEFTELRRADQVLEWVEEQSAREQEPARKTK